MRITELQKIARRRRLDTLFVTDPANIRAFADITCDNAILTSDGVLYTDFRYVPMAHRVAPDLTVRDIRRFKPVGLRIGYEASMPHARFLQFQRAAHKAKFVDLTDDLSALRAVKTPDEIARLRAAEALTCSIWEDAARAFTAGMTEKDMARLIQTQMIARGDGEAFATIVCIGANAAECHHEPDDTRWNGRDPILVDMGVRLNGVCSDLTRNLVPRRARPIYRQIYELVRTANATAIAAARPGMTAKALDKIARDVIRKGGFGKCFGHALGHGVGYEIHEAPFVSRRGDMVIEPGMVFTIEPGVYLEGNLGVRIEDLVLMTETGCEVLSKTKK